MQLAENGNDIGVVFFNLHKAFYSVPHQPLLEKLEETGLNQHLLQWIVNYLCERYQYAVVDGESSPKVKVLSGVPQGSVLSPLLFLIYINSRSLVPRLVVQVWCSMQMTSCFTSQFHAKQIMPSCN